MFLISNCRWSKCRSNQRKWFRQWTEAENWGIVNLSVWKMKNIFPAGKFQNWLSDWWLWRLLLLPLGILMMVPRSADARQFWKVFEMKARQVETRLDWLTGLPELVSEGRASRSPGGGGGCQTGGWRPVPTRGSRPRPPGRESVSEVSGENNFPGWLAWSGLSLRISPVYVGRDSSHSSRPLTPSFGYIISPKFLLSSE